VKVAVVSGTRADYGLLRPTIAALRDDERFELALLVTAMHLTEEQGSTIDEIVADGNPITARVPAGGRVERAGDYARNLGQATVAFTDALAASAPGFLLVLGDRFEILAAALAATGLGIPIAHLHGGELSEGSLDDATRHCLTKLAHLHFVATRQYAERVCQLGEEPWRVHVVGAAALESILSLELLDRASLAAALEVELEPPLISLTLHGESLEPGRAEHDAEAVTASLDEVLDGDGTVVLTLPNDDPGSAMVREQLVAWARGRERVHVYPSLGQHRYLSLLSHADAVVGNSSSAVIEAPAFRVPVVNVGARQAGRLAPANVLSVAARRDALVPALRRALDPGFRASLANMENPYGDGQVSSRILAVLAAAPPASELRRKHFFDLPDGPWRSALPLGGD
jgi:UDP-hydrolysing UDP-N-acetyl-D-glucosamine 2-epimerase